MELPPKPASSTVEPRILPGKGNVLAGKTPADEVDGFRRRTADFSDIFKPLCFRPVLREHGTTKLILLRLPDRVAKPGPFQAKLQATDPGEQRSNLHGDPNSA